MILSLSPPNFEYGGTFLWVIGESLLGARKGSLPVGILTMQSYHLPVADYCGMGFLSRMAGLFCFVLRPI